MGPIEEIHQLWSADHDPSTDTEAPSVQEILEDIPDE